VSEAATLQSAQRQARRSVPGSIPCVAPSGRMRSTWMRPNEPYSSAGFVRVHLLGAVRRIVQDTREGI
jgi:hypothetical protein